MKTTIALLLFGLLLIQSVDTAAKTDVFANPKKVELFLQSAKSGDTEQVKNLIKQGINANAKDDAGNTALFYAVRSNNYETIEFLIDAGAKTEIFNDNGNSPLTMAVVMGNMDAVKALLTNGANPNFKNDLNETALHAAVWHSSSEYVSMLVSYGADVNATTKSGTTPLMISSVKGDYATTLLLLKNGAKQKDQAHTDSAISWAKQQNHTKVASLLAENLN